MSSTRPTATAACPSNGITLIELLAVMATVLITAGIVVGLFSNAQRRAKESRAESDVQLIKRGLTEYKIKYGSLPSTNEWTRSEITNWLPEKFTFLDPWNRLYHYTIGSDGAADVRCTGSDGKENTDDDIF